MRTGSDGSRNEAVVLKSAIPFLLRIFFGDQFCGALGYFVGGFGSGLGGRLPGLLDGGGEGVAVDGDVAEEFAVGPVAAVFGLLGGFAEGLRDEVEVEVEEEGAVEEDGAFFAALGVAGEF